MSLTQAGVKLGPVPWNGTETACTLWSSYSESSLLFHTAPKGLIRSLAAPCHMIPRQSASLDSESKSAQLNGGSEGKAYPFRVSQLKWDLALTRCYLNLGAIMDPWVFSPKTDCKKVLPTQDCLED